MFERPVSLYWNLTSLLPNVFFIDFKPMMSSLLILTHQLLIESCCEISPELPSFSGTLMIEQKANHNLISMQLLAMTLEVYVQPACNLAV